MKIYLLMILILSLFVNGCGESDTSRGSGEGGSKARFTLSGDYLYTITGATMNVFDLNDASMPHRVSRSELDFDVETIFAYKSNLYIGASSGMYVYDISTITQPTKVASFTHAQSCDPVVVSDDIAYITLNTSRSCALETFGESRLEIVDVKDPSTPKLIRSIDMYAPGGLAVDGSKLFVCDGDDGLKLFDINKSEDNGTVHVNLLSGEIKSNIKCYDLIAKENILTLVQDAVIKQYDYSVDPMEILSEIK